MDKQNSEFYIYLQCIIYQQSLHGKTLWFEHVMEVVVSAANFIWSHWLKSSPVSIFLSEVNAEHGDVLYHTEVRWLSHVTDSVETFLSLRLDTEVRWLSHVTDSVETFLSLRLDSEVFMNEKGKVVAKRSDEKWLRGLAFLCDISHQANDLNTELQCEQKHFWYVWGCHAIRNQAETISETVGKCWLVPFFLRFAS
jgi:hypothetical protein